MRLSLRAHSRHVAASPVVREANRGVPGPVVGSRRTGSERARSARSPRSPAPARTDAAGIHVQSALPAARGAGQPAGHETRTVLCRLAVSDTGADLFPDLLFPDLEYHAKARLAAHHALVRRLGLLEGIDLV